MEDITFKIVVFEHNFQHGPISLYQDEFGSFVSSFEHTPFRLFFCLRESDRQREITLFLKQILNDRLQIKNEFCTKWAG